jgi:hypothetical protein
VACGKPLAPGSQPRVVFPKVEGLYFLCFDRSADPKLIFLLEEQTISQEVRFKSFDSKRSNLDPDR